jgi:hypothetical protein
MRTRLGLRQVTGICSFSFRGLDKGKRFPAEHKRGRSPVDQFGPLRQTGINMMDLATAAILVALGIMTWELLVVSDWLLRRGD